MRSDDRKRVFGIVDMDKMFQEADDRGDAILLCKFDFSAPGYADSIAEHREYG